MITDSIACSYIVAFASNWRSFTILEMPSQSQTWERDGGRAHSLLFRVGSGSLGPVVVGDGWAAPVVTDRRCIATAAGESVGAGSAAPSTPLSFGTGVGPGCSGGGEPLSTSGCGGGGAAPLVVSGSVELGDAALLTAFCSAGAGGVGGPGLGTVELVVADGVVLGCGVTAFNAPPLVSTPPIDETRSEISLTIGASFFARSTGLPYACGRTGQHSQDSMRSDSLLRKLREIQPSLLSEGGWVRRERA